LLREVKRYGTSDEQLAQIWRTTSASVRLQRARYGVTPVFKRVDTCGGRIRIVYTLPLFDLRRRRRIGRPGAAQGHDSGQRTERIGQGIEFDIVAAMPRTRCAKMVSKPSW